MFVKQSFDRFGDDLSELIFTYLTFEEKFRFECLSKQWQRLVYNKQTVLIVKENDQSFDNLFQLLFVKNVWCKTIDTNALKTVLKKCPNIHKINFINSFNRNHLSDISIDGSVLDVIIECCSRLDFFGLNIGSLGNDHDSVIRFGETLGQNIKAIDLHEYLSTDNQCYIDTRKLFLSMCPNIKSIVCTNYLFMNYQETEVLANLERLERMEISGNTESHVKGFVRFVDKHAMKMRRILLRLWVPHNGKIFVEIMTNIARFEHLEILNLEINGNLEGNKDRNVPGIGEIVSNCSELKRVFFMISNFEHDFFKLAGSFQNVKELIFTSQLCEIPDTNAKIKPLMNLKVLRIYYKSIGKHFFANVSKLAPNLKVFDFLIECEITEESLICMSWMKDLKVIHLFPNLGEEKPEKFIEKLLYYWPKLLEIELKLKSNISLESIDKLKQFAENNPKIKISLEFYSDQNNHGANIMLYGLIIIFKPLLATNEHLLINRLYKFR